jgi:tetratricopeptide (TPR) repeat protein
MRELLDALDEDPAKRRRSWFLGAAGVVALGLGTVGVQALVQDRAKRCSGAAEQLAEVWSDARRDAVQTAMLGTDAPYAAGVWERTQDELDAYAEGWTAMHTEACEATAVRHEQSEAVMDLRIGCLHRAKVELGAVVGVLETAEAKVVQKAHDVLGALEPLSRCADIEALQAEVEPPKPEEAEAVEVARARLAEAKAERKAGRYDKAQAKVDAAREALRDVTYEPVQAEFAYTEGDVLDWRGEYEASVASLERAVELGIRSNRRNVAGKALRRLVWVVGVRQAKVDEGLRYLPLARALSTDAQAEASLRDNLAAVLSAQGKYEDAEMEHRRALALREKTLGPEHPDVAASRNNLANVLSAQGKHEDAEMELRRALALYEKTLGPEHPHVATSRNNLALILKALGKYADAEMELRRALALEEKALGPEHPRVAMARNNLANVLSDQWKYEDAEMEHRRALALWEKTLGPEHPNVAMARNNLALVLSEQGKHEDAEMEFRRALAQWEKALGPEHPRVAMARNNLANALRAQGKYEDAEMEHRRALELREKTLGPEHPDVAASRNNLANALKAQGKYEDAEMEHRRALALWEKTLGSEHPDVAMSRTSLADLLLDRGEAEEAALLAEQAWNVFGSREDIPPERRASAAFVLARALWAARGDAPTRQRARELAAQAAEDYRGAGASQSDALEEVEAWLAEHRAR